MALGYRIGSVVGVATITTLVVFLANLYPIQVVFTTYTPLFWRLDPVVLSGSSFALALTLTIGVVVVALFPLYRPRPRRGLDAIFLSQQRVIVAGSFLATLGYFNYSYRLPRTTLALSFGLLAFLIPLWFVWIRRRPNTDTERAIVIGDDPEQFHHLAKRPELDFVGIVCPAALASNSKERIRADGGNTLNRLSGLARLSDVLSENVVDTAVLAFREPDRSDFFGTLDVCHDHGLQVKVHRRFSDSVLTANSPEGVLVDVDIEPWDPQDYVIKRVFDVVFSLVGLIVLLPLMGLIAIAIKLDDQGPILYSQERTAGFGDSFVVHKFRTMTVGNGNPDPNDIEDRITQVGSVLRRTHLDEIPQLWAILIGRMSVVGPRPVWVEEETVIEQSIPGNDWRRRWFVKPGLTGLAQLANHGSDNPVEKLRSDIVYIQRQSFWLDLKIVIRQVYKVGKSTLWAEAE